MHDVLNDQALDQLFREARSYNMFAPTPVTAVQIEAIYDLLRMGPTSVNCSPARFRFVMSAEARARLAACVMESNAPKVRSAPCTVIIGTDQAFYDRIPELFPFMPAARDWFATNAALAEETGFRNGTLQGAYLMMAARALGLDCGPMSGFDKAAVDAAFFAGTTIRSNFLCILGHGTTENLLPRAPRLAFDEACAIL
ncbi:MAG: malonic semialdehyde reductase [Hyphomicrobiales bacterium]|nr:malonic semialdehyde reductase [Hyphomicrobiales bacterium]